MVLYQLSMSSSIETIQQTDKPIFVCDIDSVLVDPRKINALWLPGEPRSTELPADESATAEAYNMDLQAFYRAKDQFLQSQDALDVEPIKDSPDVLGLVAVFYTVVFASARVPAVHSHTLAWLEKNYGHEVGELQQDLRLFTIGNDATNFIDSKESIYAGFGAAAMIDDKKQHHLEAKRAGVSKRIYYQDANMGGTVRTGSTPKGSRLAATFKDVKKILVPKEFEDTVTTTANQF